MDCNKFEKKLIFYLDGDLPLNESQSISQHLMTCEECASKLEYLRDNFQIIDFEKSTELKPFLFTRIKARMEQNAPMVKRWILAPLAIASVLAVGLFFGTFISNVSIQRSSLTAQADHEVFYLFNDAQMENTENMLLNN